MSHNHVDLSLGRGAGSFRYGMQETRTRERSWSMREAIKDKNDRTVGYLEDGYAYSLDGKPIFKQDGMNLRDLTTGEVICHLTPSGLANTPGHESDGNASRYFTTT
jgi:hypothetical protein